MLICDFGWAILIAVAEVFAKCIDLRYYMKICFNILHDINVTMTPKCFIRLDVSHFIRMISRWDCLKHKDKLLVRKFYIRLLSQAYKMTTLDNLSTVFEAILIVALSDYVGFHENGKQLPSESCLQYLNNLIKDIPTHYPLHEINENDEIDEIDGPEEINNQDASDWHEWSTNIFDKAKQLALNCTEGTTMNACYNPDFAKILKTRVMPYV